MGRPGEMREKIRSSLERYIAESGYTQKEIAEKLGVSKSSVTNWIKGKNSPDANLVMPICNLLNITIGQFYGEDSSGPLEKPSPGTGKNAPEGAINDMFDYLNKALMSMGFIKKDQDLTAKQADVLIGICQIIRATFDEN